MTNLLSRLLLATALTCAFASQTFAQDTTQPHSANSPPKKVVLVADTVRISAEGLLVAEGNVEALADGIRLQAKEVTYDNQTGQINFEGPIRITQGEDVSIIADAAELDDDLRSGLIRSARVVLAGQMQMASAEMKRLDARFNVLNQTTVSSCRVCQTGEPPLWRIRAKRVVHDQKERQIYFDHASLLIRDVPIFYFPHLRMPDPTLDRTQGFLIPTFESTSLLGYGLKVPYFIPFGETRDLTLTPYLTSETRTMEFRYRQGFEKGGIEFNGAVSDDTILPDITRGYVFANGLFDLGRDYKLTFNLRAVSDDSYLSDYDYSDLDRLNSNIKISRANRNESTEFAFHHFKSLRAEEDNDTLPSLVLQAQTERRYFPASIGGEIRTRVEAHGHQRRSSADGNDGRDVGRANASLQWLRNWTLRGGLRAGVTGELAFDAYRTLNDSSVSSFDSAITPSISVDFRYPMAKIAADGATYLLEPVAQIGWTGGNNLDVANDESTRNEFDEGNLLSLSRFTSYDRRERGAQTAVGLNWSRLNTKGWQSHVSLGQIFRSEAQSDFTQTSGLSGTTSDFLIAGQLKNQTGLLLNARGLIDPNGTLDKASARVGWSNSTLWLDASYIWLNEDLQENRDQEISELALDSRYRLARHWTGLLDWRFDAVSGRASEAGLGLEYRNECVKVELSLSRRFSTSSTVQSSTSVGLSVALLGFSVNSNNKSYDRTCG